MTVHWHFSHDIFLGPFFFCGGELLTSLVRSGIEREREKVIIGWKREKKRTKVSSLLSEKQ